ncbi:ferredoxin C 2, chloroplastic-like [Curcuma longa]|uniref:ferredoxin C 2, chloroplastic-like n=1 Tax=Curcuma longa TaxID=136217 RepID=UPI003D9E50ED
MSIENKWLGFERKEAWTILNRQLTDLGKRKYSQEVVSGPQEQEERGFGRRLIGCCTSCAVRVKSGQIRQPEALGISAELKDKGYALLCVGFPSSDIEVETQDEDEVYWLQFGQYFVRGPVERDDYALELAMGDE